jgi:hypothetical protein
MSRKRTLLTVILLSATPAAASPGASPAAPPAAGPTDHPLAVASALASAAAPPPPPDASAAPALLALRTQLLQTPRAEAKAQLATFRPLCDRDGYPLVGNVASKGNVDQPSQVCSYVRDAQKPHR